MKIEIDLDEAYVNIIGTWASVQAALKESASLLSLFDEGAIVDFDQIRKRVQRNLEELQAIGPALDALHQATQTSLLEMEDKGLVSFNRA